MDKKEVLLLGLSGGHRFSPVQVQKLFFLIDKNAGVQIGGPFFNFVPYAYGPFDKTVYTELKLLADSGLIEISYNSRPSQRYYQLSQAGERGRTRNSSKSEDRNCKVHILFVGLCQKLVF